MTSNRITPFIFNLTCFQDVAPFNIITFSLVEPRTITLPRFHPLCQLMWDGVFLIGTINVNPSEIHRYNHYNEKERRVVLEAKWKLQYQHVQPYGYHSQCRILFPFGESHASADKNKGAMKCTFPHNGRSISSRCYLFTKVEQSAEVVFLEVISEAEAVEHNCGIKKDSHP